MLKRYTKADAAIHQRPENLLKAKLGAICLILHAALKARLFAVPVPERKPAKSEIDTNEAKNSGEWIHNSSAPLIVFSLCKVPIQKHLPEQFRITATIPVGCCALQSHKGTWKGGWKH